ncbi:LysR family transcriptional regulator [Pectinatus cerevisiiphilus]|uniref:DNA-binding transcriptional LysR family regulator n=1 Tax=Pectinatus cerevisiiphilus TaxID=86956 RepID=A0A4R3KEU9_9FIRM|nr:LysR family transcriptional regulator [Pectinatus cerevisiiphilus]TCS81886.1 DNA-binding transcriptional LysR family regulator [Pectinatus cerevisiiphilus]
MELQQLEYFLSIAHIGNFTKAAKAVSITQSALSRSIIRLEKELGVQLLNRNTKEVTLTRYGEMLLTHAERIVKEETAAKMEIDKPDKQIINLSFLHSLGSYIVPRLISSFRQTHPSCKFKLNQDNSTVLTELLVKGKTDLCICSNLLMNETIGWLPLCSEELFVIVPLNHPLAKKDSVNLQDIADESFITLKPFYGLRLLANQLFDMTGVTPHIEFEGDEIVTVANLVAADLGVSLIPKIPGMDRLNLKFLHLSSPHCRRTIGIAWDTSKMLSPLVYEFQKFALDSFADER